MTEPAKPESELANQLVNIGRKYLKVLNLSLDGAIKYTERPPKVHSAKPVDLGIKGWLKGPKPVKKKE